MTSQRALIASFSLCNALVACGDQTCTDQPHTALTVSLTSDEGIDPQRVTAERDVELDCYLHWASGSERPDSYSCADQGAGEYTVRVFSEALTWTRTVEVGNGACHVTTAHVAIELSAASAD